MAPLALWSPRFQNSPSDPAAEDAAAHLALHLGCPLPLARILAARRITTPVAADAFLRPTLQQFLADPNLSPDQLLGMRPAVGRVVRALQTGEPILVYGDYDVDGTTATVLLKTTLERIALALDPSRPADVRYHVPHRILEGYGMRASVLAQAAADGVRLVISVDTGIRAFEEAREARALGLDLIVTDHHLPDEYRAPDCLAIINPAQPGCPYPEKHLCGAAVAFKLAHALLLAAAPLTPDPAAFRRRIEDVLIPSFLKLVAIATIADSVPLTGENRILATLGLQGLAHPVQPGIRALMQLAKLPTDRPPTASEVAFRLAPRINAAGRMEVASDVVELFLTRDTARAQSLAEKLDGLNQTRRDAEASALSAIDRHLSTLLGQDGDYPADCVILENPEWHRGVLGILASRVVERTHRPALVIQNGEADAHGSGRSIHGFHLLDALVAAEEFASSDRLFHRFGGHAHAVGFSLPSHRVAELRARISGHAAIHLTETVLTPVRHYDDELDASELDAALAQWVEKLAPFGHGNPEPVFLLRSVVLARPPRVIKDRHICLELQWPQPAADSSAPPHECTLSALGWSRTEDAADRTSWPSRCRALNLDAGSAMDLLIRLRRKTGPYANVAFAGLELELEDIRLSATASFGKTQRDAVPADRSIPAD